MQQQSDNQSKMSAQELENEKKRNDIRLALARRMKFDLVQAGEFI